MSFNDIEGLDKLQENVEKLAQAGVKGLNKGLDELSKGLERINNPEASEKSKVPEVCPYCGAKLPQDKEATTIKCEYCGAEFDNSNEKTIVDSVFDFVEKQQQISAQEREKKLEIERLKALKRVERKKKSFFRNIILLIIIVIAVCYYYVNYMGGTLPF